MAFGKDFWWGAATSSYQIEGAAYEDGKGLNIWDVFCQEEGRIFGGHTGDIACDHYHRFREDVEIMKKLGLKAYRFLSTGQESFLMDMERSMKPESVFTMN